MSNECEVFTVKCQNLLIKFDEILNEKEDPKVCLTVLVHVLGVIIHYQEKNYIVLEKTIQLLRDRVESLNEEIKESER